jgi:hypothetical protein
VKFGLADYQHFKNNGMPPDVPRCRGLKPGMPCPVPDDCDCKRMDAEMDAAYHRNDRIVLYVSLVLALAAAISFFAVWKTMAADVDRACLSKAEARAKYQTSHLYWHGSGHCWDNRATRATTKGDRLPLHRPKLEPDGALVQKTIVAAGPTVAYPDLMPGGGTVVAMLQPEAMTRWPLVADFDADPPQFTPWRERVMPVGR